MTASLGCDYRQGSPRNVLADEKAVDCLLRRWNAVNKLDDISIVEHFRVVSGSTDDAIVNCGPVQHHADLDTKLKDSDSRGNLFAI